MNRFQPAISRRSFLSIAAGAPLAAVVPAVSPAEAAHGQVLAKGITADKLKFTSLSEISAVLSNVTIRNATIGPLFVSASNISARSITVGGVFL